jgi:hypothetical protein
MPVVEVPGMGDVEFPDDMTDEQISAAIRKNLQPSAPPVSGPSMGGMGGFNPFARLAERAEEKAGTELGMTRENLKSPMLNALGPLETAWQGVTGVGGAIAGGYAGLGQGLKNLVSPGMPAADRQQQVQDAITYQPRTGAGNAMSRVIGLPGEAWSAGTNKAGEFVADKTGLPSLGAGIKTAGDIAPAVIGARGTPRMAPRQTGGYTPTRMDVPTTEQLKAASREAYGAAKESGVMVPARGYSEALEGIKKMATEEGVDKTLHPKSSAVLARLDEAAGKDLTLQEAETLRKIALDAEDDLNPVTRQPTPDARLAGKIVDELDEKIDALATNAPARALWSRSKRSEMIDRAIHRAEIKAGAHYTQAGMEHALRSEFKQLALNERRMRGLTKEQRAAVEKVAKGGALENVLRNLGKFDPSTGGMAAFTSVGLGAGLSGFTGGASFALPAAGFIAKRRATNMTASNVEKARSSLVGHGLPSVVQPSRGAPTLPSVGQLGAPGGARTAASIRSDIARLQSRAGNLPRGTRPDSPEARMLFQELSVLSEELARAEAASAAGTRAVQ